MLRKLLKYDLKYSYKALIVFYILSILFAVLSRLCLLSDSNIMIILYKVNCGITISMMVNILINNLLRIWVRFNNNIYKDESYLTHTLPVEKRDIYSSKILAAIISVLTSIIVIFVCLVLCYYSKENIELLKNSLNIVANAYSSSITNVLLTLFLILFLEFTFIILTGFDALILGHKSNDNKMIKSVIYGLVIYMIFNVLLLLIVYLLGTFNTDIMAIFSHESIKIETIKILLNVIMIVYVIYLIILYLFGIKEFKKGVNVE